MRLWHSLHSIAVSVALLIGGLTSAALAVTTIPWTGDNNFNDEAIYFKAFQANELTDITGYGQYEGCCTSKSTAFSMYLLVSTGKDNHGHWSWHWQLISLPWLSPLDEKPLSMDSLAPGAIKFSDKPLYVSGIYLKSDPNGKGEKSKDGKDYNFTNFNYVTYMSRDEYYEKHKSKYKSRKDYDECDDYEQYIRKLTSFVFDTSTGDTTGQNPLPTPLPAALPLMGSVLGGFGIAMWRRRRKRKVA
jgi:hypothetical protein